VQLYPRSYPKVQRRSQIGEEGGEEG